MASLLDKLGKKSEGKKEEARKDKVKEDKKQEKKEVAKPKKSDSKKKVKVSSRISRRVLIRPLVSEKGAREQEANKYLFEVGSGANKIMIKEAVESLYDVDVVKVNIVNMTGKRVSFARRAGKRRSWKKAVVTLKPGQRIATVEGV